MFAVFKLTVIGIVMPSTVTIKLYKVWCNAPFGMCCLQGNCLFLPCYYHIHAFVLVLIIHVVFQH